MQNTTRWPLLGRFSARERLLATRMARRGTTAALYEFVRFGLKQAWACLFGGLMVGALLVTHWLWPADAWLARYDFLFVMAAVTQVMLLRFGLETWEEARIILIFHLIGTGMELFKTSHGSWIYPEACVIRIAGVPLFSGFMYASVGSYLCRAWRLFDFRFVDHPNIIALGCLSLANYVNFFSHHYVWDMRWPLFAAAGLLYYRTEIYYRVWRRYRSMPLLLGQLLVTLFIWLAENIGTLGAGWLYPHQAGAWSLVRFRKFGSWFLLLTISYTLVAMINRPVTLEGVSINSKSGRRFQSLFGL